MSDQPHKLGCPAQPGYGHGIEPCICGVSDQPQKWTPKYVKELMWGVNGGVERVAYTHNAALATERERVTMIMATDCKLKLDTEREKFDALGRRNVELKRMLDAERQRSKSMGILIDQLERQIKTEN